jgi:hypothetical protein
VPGRSRDVDLLWQRRGGGNLPAELTSFVGRRGEVAEVRRLLADSRLVTLTGVGGVGKTRLALRAAAGLARAFRDGVWLVGVWLVQLDQLREQALVAQAVARSACTAGPLPPRPRRWRTILPHCRLPAGACRADGG